jgi:serine/threonine-protein kinase RsbW
MARRRKKTPRRRAAPRRRSAAPARSAPVNLVRDFPATPAAAERALEDTMRALAAAGCACGDMDEVKMALREALNNAVRHGSRLNPRKRVHLKCRYDPKTGLGFVVRDEGNGFDPKKIPDPTAPENLERFSGRGIYMIRQLMDKVEFRDRGRELRLRRLPAAAGRPRQS